MVYDLRATLDELAAGEQRQERDCPITRFMLDLETEIAGLSQMKSAHPAGSDHHVDLQHRIVEPTVRWLAAKTNAAPLAEVNEQIAEHRREVDQLRADADQVGGRYFKPAAALGAVGVVLVLAGAAFGIAWYLWLVAVAALGGGGLLVWYGLRVRADAQDDLDDAQAELGELRERRRGLIPDRHAEIDVNAVLDSMMAALDEAWLDCPVCGAEYGPEDTIARLNALKSAQEEDGEYWVLFQRWIDQIQDAWRAARDGSSGVPAARARPPRTAPGAGARGVVVDEPDMRLFKVAAWLGVPGLVLVLAGAAIGLPVLLWLLTGLLLAGAVAGVGVGLRARMAASRPAIPPQQEPSAV